MQKLLYTGDQEELVTQAGRIMTFVDDARQIKSAASSAFSEKMIREHAPDDKHFAIHLISLGAGETYGFNKNGDSWPRKGLMHEGGNYGHHTFVKNGHFFREHANDDPKKKIGDVKAAAFNEPMDRGELIIWGNKKKAEEEYELAKKGKQLSFSMSARVPGDTCSCCSQFSKKSRDYCVHLKKSMTQWLPKFSKFAYAVNDEPNFFDISRVVNPADRIAHYLQYLTENNMAKAASEVGFVFSDMLAKTAGGRIIETPELGCESISRQSILNDLAEYETYLSNPNPSDRRYHFVKNCSVHAFSENQFDDAQITILRKMDPDVLCYFLAKRASLLPLDAFQSYLTGHKLADVVADPVYKYARIKLMPTLFNDLLKVEADGVLENMFVPSDSIKAAACSSEDPIETLLDKVEPHSSVAKPVINIRIIRICAGELPGMSSEPDVKSAASYSDEVINKAKTLARTYGLYKIAFQEAVGKLVPEEVIDENTKILITCRR